MSTSSATKRLDTLRHAIASRFSNQEIGRHIARNITMVEPLLVLAIRCDNPPHADKANLLISNYRLLQPRSFGAREHVLQMARHHLMPLTSGRNWLDKLEAYMDKQARDFRMFDIVDNEIVRRPRVFGDGSENGSSRENLYIDWMLEPISHKGPVPRAQEDVPYTYWAQPEHEQQGKTERTSEAPQGGPRTVSIPTGALAASAAASDYPDATSSHKGVRPPITFSLDELIDAAREIGGLTGQKHLATVLEAAREQGLFKHIDGDGASAANHVTVERIVNMVGIVGSGKSVFANVLTFACAKRGLRVAVVQNSITDVMDSVEFFEKLGVDASPLTSQRDRLNHLDELASKREQMLLDDALARHFETPCLLDGMAEHADAPTGYASAPCFDLKDSAGHRRACPFFGICPTQSMVRMAFTSNVVVTTPAGFTQITVGAGRRPFFEHVLADFDLVIFDEADRVQSQLDGQFAPSESFGSYIRNSADPIARTLKRDPRDKVSDPDAENFHDLRYLAERIMKALVAGARKPAIAKWGALKDRTFTSLSLLELLRGTDETPAKLRLPEILLDDLQRCIAARGAPHLANEDLGDVYLRNALDYTHIKMNDRAFQQELNGYLAQRNVEISPMLHERLGFTLKVVSFDNYLHELDQASDMLAFKDESTEMLYNFLHASTSRQAPYLPASPVGNLCGFKITEDNDIQLYRQFGTGRAFMTALPWLDTDESGSPCGPHALLLSGSSYEPGCLQYHINQPVDYLLDAKPEIAEFLSRSTVCDLGIDVNVSGSGTKRRENLNLVLKATVDALVKEMDDPSSHKILVIVNSYDETIAARNVLQSALRHRGRGEKVCALVKRREERDDDALPRGQVHQFAQHSARILVAPAMAIERGFNIVDARGHSAIDTLVFAVRPMATPHDLMTRFKRMVGATCEQSQFIDAQSPLFEQQVREAAWRQWTMLERDEALSLSDHSSPDDYLSRDIIATLMVLIVQIFGRLARIRDANRRPPHVYFADAAFTGGNGSDAQTFRTLDLLTRYMGNLIAHSDQPTVAHALYGPFYIALTKGIQS